MLKGIKKTSRFKKDIKSYQHNKKVLDKLNVLLNLILNESEIPANYNKHQLNHQYKGEWDYHVCPNVVLICHIEDDILVLSRIGPHNKLELTESLYRR